MSQAHQFEGLRPHVEGDLFLDLPRRLLYSTSASSNSVVPEAVLRPKQESDLIAAVEFCREEGVPLIPRGAATGMSGANLGKGLVVDFCRYLRKVMEIDSKSGRVRVQPGVIYGDLNKLLEPVGLFLPPDPSSGAYCTLGGMVANNSAGPHTVKYGSTRDFVLSVSGIDSRAQRLAFTDREFGALDPLEVRIAEILKKHQTKIQRGYPAVTKNSSGYLLQSVLHEKGIHLAKLACGSEGTLALFSEIEFRVVALPPRRGVVFAAFDSLEAAGDAVLAARALNPSALEIIDRSLIQAILKAKIAVGEKLTSKNEAALLVEFEGGDDDEVMKGLRRVEEALRPLASSLVLATDLKEQKKLWDLRKGAAVKARREDWKKPIRVIEDAAVPLNRIADYIRGARKILASHNAEAILVGHAGNGNIHVEPLLDVRSPQLKETIQSLAAQVSSLVRDLGGTLSGEHGDGIVRSPYLPKIYPELIPVFQEIKQLFDPKGILNPGVILPYPKARELTDELRYGFEPVYTGTSFDDMHHEIERCFSCGVCRNYCPAYADSGEEESLPRARAALLRGLVGGVISAGELFGSAEAKNVFELCFNCGRCAPECPAGFDSARLATVAKGYFESASPSSPVEKLLTSPKELSERIHATPSWVLPILNQPAVRQLGSSLCGISSEREIPKLAERTLSAELSARVHPESNGTRGTLVYFPGCYAQFNDPQGEGLGTIFCLEQNGFRVEVPEFECCGIAQLSNSGFSRAEDDAEKNVERMLPEIRAGKTIVFSSPSCGHAVTEEYPYFMLTEESHDVAKHSRDACRLLADLLESGELKKPGPLKLRVAYHNPCHLRVRGLGPEAIALLRAIPQLELVEMPDRCCGMAGTFGVKERHYDRSMAIAAPQIEAVQQAKVDVVATACGTCQMQMEHGARTRSVHPLAILARAYGLTSALAL